MWQRRPLPFLAPNPICHAHHYAQSGSQNAQHATSTPRARQRVHVADSTRRHLVVREARVPRQRQQRLAGSHGRGRDQPPAPPVALILRDAQHLYPTNHNIC